MDAPGRFWQRRRVFLTGCTGLLGSRVAAALVESDANVSALIRDRAASGFFFENNLHASVRIVRGRIEDRPRLETSLAIHDPEVIFHLAKPRGEAPADSTGTFAWTLLAAARIAAPSAAIVLPSSTTRTRQDDVVDGFRATTASPIGVARMPTLGTNLTAEDAAVFMLALAERLALGPTAGRMTASWPGTAVRTAA